MDTYSWPYELSSRCIRTTRQKKRLQKKDYQKKLIRLQKLKRELWWQRRALPMVPLKEPYQKGWKRSFVLREDVARSNKAPFYAAILAKINTIMYATDKSFKKKKRRHRKRVYVDRPQYVKAFYLYEWYSAQNRLTEVERALFYLREETDEKKTVYRYAFAEPWRFVLKVEPHIILEAKMVDEVLEQQIAQLDNYITRNHLSPKMDRAVGYSHNKWRHYNWPSERNRNPLRNVPMHSILGGLLDDAV